MNTYTKQELDIELLKQKNDDIYRNFDHTYRLLDKMEAHQKWMLGIMGTGFTGLLGFMAHGFKWLI